MTIATAFGRKGVVAAGHALAAQAARDVIEDGGNAVDGAVAAALMLCVLCPYACSLAGDLYMLIRTPGSGEIFGLNGTGHSPECAVPALFPNGIERQGARSATIPGFVAAIGAALDRFGTRDFKALSAFAVTCARKGFEVHPYFTRNIEDRQAMIDGNEAAHALFRPRGRSLQPGDLFVQTRLADTLEHLGEAGLQDFYDGDLAKAILADMAELGGLFTARDLAAHRSLWQQPIVAGFHGHMVSTMPPNSFGLALLLELQALERADPDADFVETGYRIRQAAYRSATPLTADPEISEIKARQFLQDGRAPSPSAAPETAVDGSTTNVVVIDRENMAVSLIQSISTPFGAGVLLPRTGLVLNNRLAGFNLDMQSLNCLAGAKRPAHTLAPCLVTHPEGRLISLGTPGTMGQTCTLAQILWRILGRGQAPEAAIAAPRWSIDFERRLIVEPEMTDAVPEGTKIMPRGWISFGSIKLVQADQGVLAGYADDRRMAATCAF